MRSFRIFDVLKEMSKKGEPVLSKNKFMVVFFVASLLLFIKPALAENPISNDTPWEKFSLNAGYFISNTNTDLRLGSGLGLTVNVEDLLGLEPTIMYLE